MKATAVVPAYNEAERIGHVLSTLLTYPGFSSVIVVDDGSTDNTSIVSEAAGARVIRLETNKGKGAAMDVGVEAADDVIFFCDADISGLNHHILDEIVQPVLRGEYDMCIAARHSKVRHLGFGVMFSPLIDGQRALTKDLWKKVPPTYKRGYEIEVALNHIGARSHKGFMFKHYNITQVRKEEKRGFMSGRIARYKMYRDIAIAKTRLALEMP